MFHGFFEVTYILETSILNLVEIRIISGVMMLFLKYDFA